MQELNEKAQESDSEPESDEEKYVNRENENVDDLVRRVSKDFLIE